MSQCRRLLQRLVPRRYTFHTNHVSIKKVNGIPLKLEDEPYGEYVGTSIGK